jgi:hypothetical protein
MYENKVAHMDRIVEVCHSVHSYISIQLFTVPTNCTMYVLYIQLLYFASAICTIIREN